MDHSTDSTKRNVLKAALLGTILVAGCSPQSTKLGESTAVSSLRRIVSEKRIRIGYVSLPPWAKKDALTNSLKGTFVSLANMIFEKAGIKIEYIETTWSTFVAGLQTGTYDLSIVPSYPTPDRALAVAFCDQISYLENSALIKSNDARFRKVSDLNRSGVRIVAIEGEQSAEYVRKNLSLANLKTLGGGDFALLYSEVLAGRADAAFGDSKSIADFSKANTSVKDIDAANPYSKLPICWATAYEANDLRQFINACIAYYKGDGTIEALNSQ
jgi:ABC-type amino acid transport substrate-binding protein